MDTAFHEKDFLASEFPENEFPGVTWNRGDGETRFREGDFADDLDIIGKHTQSRS